MNFADAYLDSKKDGQGNFELKKCVRFNELRHKGQAQCFVSTHYDTNTDYYLIYKSDYKAFKKWIHAVYSQKSNNYVSKIGYLQGLSIKKFGNLK